MTADAAPTSAGIDALIEEVRFATDSLVEEAGFELLVPLTLNARC